jgi:flagellar hook-length control protein FliK
MISGLSLPAAPASPPAIPTAAPAPAGTPGFAQALHDADQPAPAPQPGRPASSPAQRPPGAPPADAAPEPAPEEPAARSSEPPQAKRSPQAPRSPSRPAIGTIVADKADTPAGTDAESRPSSAVVPREEEPLAPIAASDAPPSLQALLAGLQPPSDPVPTDPWGAPAPALPVSPCVNTTLLPAHAAMRGVVQAARTDAESRPSSAVVPREENPLAPIAVNDAPPSLQALLAGLQPPSDPVPAALWGAPAPALPVSPYVNTALLPAHAAVRGVVRLEPDSAVANPTAPLIAGDGTGPTTRSPAAATLTSDASTTAIPPAIISEAISPGPVAPSSPLIQASATQAAPATSSASLQPATQAQIAASPHSAAFGPELGAQISTFVRHGVERAQLQLHPAEMGPVTVQILVEGANAQVRLWAEQPGTRQALELAMPALAGQLRESGLTLTGGGVFEQPRQEPEQTRRETGAGGPASPHPTADPAPLAFAAPARRRGLVDLVA